MLNWDIYIDVKMTTISGLQLPATSGGRSMQAPAGAIARDSQSEKNPASGRVSRITSGGKAAAAVFSYGHTAQLQHSDRLGTQLDTHA
jgi:hypothetical protein